MTCVRASVCTTWALWESLQGSLGPAHFCIAVSRTDEVLPGMVNEARCNPLVRQAVLWETQPLTRSA